MVPSFVGVCVCAFLTPFKLDETWNTKGGANLNAGPLTKDGGSCYVILSTVQLSD